MRNMPAASINNCARSAALPSPATRACNDSTSVPSWFICCD